MDAGRSRTNSPFVKLIAREVKTTLWRFYTQP